MHLNSKFVIISLLVLLAADCGNQSPVVIKHTFYRMDTIVDLIIVNKKSFNADPLWSEIDSVLKNWEERFSITTKNSEIKKINDRVHDTIPISKQLGDMVSSALQYGDSLNGAFDFTILPLKSVWGLSEDSPENAPLPTTQQVDSARALVDYRKVHLNNQHDTLYFSSRMVKIDIGGVAKGFAMRRVEELLLQRGITSFLLNGGGDIVGRGKKPDGSSWVIGVQDPRKQDQALATFKLDSGAVFTSGDYERFRIVNGVRIHHIFNPHTGYSCTGNQSVTIYGQDAIQCKFLSTGLFCRSADSILEYVNKRPKIECLVVDSLGKVFVSDRWKGKVTFTTPQ